MVELPADSGLAFELLEISRRELLGVDDLGRELESARLLDAAADYREGPFAELLLQVVIITESCRHYWTQAAGRHASEFRASSLRVLIWSFVSLLDLLE